MTSSIKSMLIENYYELKLCSTCTCNLGKKFIWQDILILNTYKIVIL